MSRHWHIKKLQIRLIRSVGILLLVVCFFELITIFSQSKALSAKEPLTGLKYEIVISLVATIEALVGTTACFFPGTKISIWALGWLGISLCGYRLARLALGINGPCKCLGQLMAWWPWGERNEGILSWGIIVLILLISVFSIFSSRQRDAD
jgi:hypothetical protein